MSEPWRIPPSTMIFVCPPTARTISGSTSAVDGVSGSVTETAVRVYQTLFGLTPSGAVGAETWNSVADTYRTLVQGDEGSSAQFGGVIS